MTVQDTQAYITVNIVRGFNKDGVQIFLQSGMFSLPTSLAMAIKH